ncbi:hypothetical protein MUO14_05740 [Halobacillus shinanisalinarum]|uniref:ATPase BadF/BadG/BcrA/BcrD type domain-containing protein n=1 Tax=Halobacillus shinanisalinarum TaxID=2932258 RepID=A0ABY4H2E0_9BACI|nr:BadF/BadG/BcrA/BcrD ATPase family protein [Halobacillus shinanisalinarum]UOQ94456.1 hypothetical protein MUO14_05740 [Halobacillus shinanisalinarum]
MIIGIDAGGTSTKGALINEQEEVLFTFESGYGNPLVNEHKAFQHIENVIGACMQATLEPVNHIVIGMAGYETLKNKIVIPDSWHSTEKITLISDAELAYEAGLAAQEGILTIAGTGSIHVGKKDEQLFIRGGWGHLLGDEGGGYDLGRSAVQRVAYTLEMDLKRSPFCQKILTYMGVTDVNGVKMWFYAQDKSGVGKLALLVERLAKEGDREALELLEEKACELAAQVQQLYTRMQLDERSTLVIAGSVLLESEHFQSYFTRNLTCTFCEVKRLDRPAYMGAFSVARKKENW